MTKPVKFSALKDIINKGKTLRLSQDGDDYLLLRAA
jgi:hypothetical protein